MFLTRQSLNKIRFITITYCLLSLLCFVAYGIFAYLLIDARLLLILGIISIVLGAVFRLLGKYAEGKGKLINEGNKLILQELRPAEFIRLYEEKRDCPDNVISEPDFEVLQLLTTAYDASGNTEKALETLDQMILMATQKKKTFAKLLKASVLFSISKTEEAKLLYNEVLNGEMDFITKATLDVVTKSDRAMALGDFEIAEAYFKQKLERKSVMDTPLFILTTHFSLGKIYYWTQRTDEAKFYLNYCIENGGETNIKSEAADILKNL